jgi:transketolase
MTNAGKSSHVGSILSMLDIIAVLYGSVMNFRPNEPKWTDRDRLILSKGHAGAGLYAILAEMWFYEIRKIKNTLSKWFRFKSGHISHKGIPGVEFQQDL